MRITWIRELTTIIALFVGVIWFVYQEEAIPKANITHEIADRLLTKESRWVHVAITITNPGKTMLILGDGTIRIQQILPLNDSIAKALAHLGKNNDANGITANENHVVYWPPLYADYHPRLPVQIAPGEAATVYCEFVIPSSLKTVKIYSDFSERKASSGDLLKLYFAWRNPERPRLVWQTTTIYDPRSS